MGNYTYCKLRVPKSTPMNYEMRGYYNPREDGNFIEYSCSSYSDHNDAESIMDELIHVFGPLTKVRGMYLYMEYSDYDDGYTMYTLEIRDGRATYKESEVIMVEYPIDEECMFGTLS